MVIIVIVCQALELYVTKQVNDSVKDKEAVKILPRCLQGHQAAVLCSECTNPHNSKS